MLTREQLLEQVWGYTFMGDSRTIDVHVRQLRRKLERIQPCRAHPDGLGHGLQGARQAVNRWAPSGAPRPWRTLRGRLALAAAGGLFVAAIVFAAVGGGLIRAQSQKVARDELDRQAVALAGS